MHRRAMISTLAFALAGFCWTGPLLLTGCGNTIFVETGSAGSTTDASSSTGEVGDVSSSGTSMIVASVASVSVGIGVGGGVGVGGGFGGSGPEGGFGGAPSTGHAFVDISQTEVDSIAYARVDPASAFTGGDPPDCGRVTEGSCYYENCPYAPLAKDAIDGGPIFVHGGKKDVSLAYSAGAYQPEYDDPDGVYQGGESLLFVVDGNLGQGGSVPPLSAKVTGTTEVIVDQSIEDYAKTYRSQDYTFTWTEGAAADSVSVCAGPGINGGAGAIVCCVVPASSGTATLPSTLLSLIHPGASGFIEIESFNQSTVEVGGWKLDATVETTAYDKADGVFVVASVFH